MKLLLTSNGLTNKAIKNAFVDLVGKPAADIKVAFIPTAAMVEDEDKGWLIDHLGAIKSLGCYIDIVDLAQLTKDEWLPRVEICDVIFVGGGLTFYLSYWMQKSGLMKMLPKLLKTKVYVGISAGSMVVANSLHVATEALEQFGQLKDDEYDELGPAGRSSAKTAQLVKFEVRPHLNSKKFRKVRSEHFVKRVSKTLDVPMYAFDDNVALKVIDGNVEIIGPGKCLVLNKTSVK